MSTEAPLFSKQRVGSEYTDKKTAKFLKSSPSISEPYMHLFKKESESDPH